MKLPRIIARAWTGFSFSSGLIVGGITGGLLMMILGVSIMAMIGGMSSPGRDRCVVFGASPEDMERTRACAERGDVSSILRLSTIMGSRGRAEESERLFQSVAGRPHGEGEWLIAKHGTTFSKGKVYSLGVDERVEWYLKAHSKGMQQAAVEAARLLVLNDRHDEARPLIEDIARWDPGHAALLAEDLSDAVRWVKPAAEMGDPRAEYTFAVLLKEGKGGAERDQARSEEWMLRAAAHADHDERALLAAADIMDKGGVSAQPDRRRALDLYRKALSAIDSSDGGARRRVEEKIARLSAGDRSSL